jgi:hypothetical protein
MFAASQGRMAQITEFATPLGGGAHVSYDGRRVAFFATKRPASLSDLFLLETGTNEVRSTNLRSKLHRIPQGF